MFQRIPRSHLAQSPLWPATAAWYVNPTCQSTIYHATLSLCHVQSAPIPQIMLHCFGEMAMDIAGREKKI